MPAFAGAVRSLRGTEKQIEETMERLKFKVSRYQAAVETGVLSWDEKECK